MKDYRHGSHSVFELHVHLVWSTKYRKRILKKDVGHRLREILRQVCSDHHVEILSGAIAKDHVHVLVSMPPQLSVSKLIQKMKGKSSYKLQREYQSLRREYWGNVCGQEATLLVARAMSLTKWLRLILNIILMERIVFILILIDFQSGFIRL